MKYHTIYADPPWGNEICASVNQTAQMNLVEDARKASTLKH